MLKLFLSFSFICSSKVKLKFLNKTILIQVTYVKGRFKEAGRKEWKEIERERESVCVYVGKGVCGLASSLTHSLTV